MSNSFQSIQVRKPSKNMFDLSHDVKYSMDMGTLTPVLVQEVLPGDVFNIQTETLIRFAPLVAPVMHNIKVFTHYFFVPNRITWPNWEDFISPDLSKSTTVTPSWPMLRISRNSSVVGAGSLWDYLGLPVSKVGLSGNFPDVSALPFAAYQCIYNEYYRDQNLIPEVKFELSNGSNNSGSGDNLLALRRRAWQHDYFTSALPFAQKGPAVDIPMSVNATDVPITKFGLTDTGYTDITTSTSQNVAVENTTSINLGEGSPRMNTLYAKTSDMGLSGAGTINDLRTALKLQEWFEKAARGGSRYVEQLMVHWSVKSSDARLNRPEFLGGTRNPVIISEVLQTSETSETPQASMAGHGLSAGSGKRIRYYAEEHGYIIGIQSIMPSTAYQQGLPRHFTRQSWEDYAWPTFAHLGEQEILNKELYVDPTDSKDNEVFGYIPRYSEYRYTPSRVAGEFRDSLAFWHLGRIFANRPTLSRQFIEADPRKDIFAVTDDSQQLWCHSYHKVFVKRSLPKYGTPTL